MSRSQGFDVAPFASELAEGPKPLGAHWIYAADTTRLRIAYWEPKATAKGTIFIFQGRTENLEKYGRAVAEIEAAGYAACAIDWRGQGLSDRIADDPMMGHVGTYKDYQQDVAALFEAAPGLELPKPWFIFAHSLGACITLRALSQGLPISACAVTGPLWGINLAPLQRLGAWPLSWAAQALGRGATYAPGTEGKSYVLTNPFEDNRLTKDPDSYRYYQTLSEKLEEQRLGGPSLNWLYQTLKETRALRKMPSPNVPCIAFCGSEDSIVAKESVTERMARWPGGTYHEIAGGRHDVLYEVASARCEVFEKMFAFFDAASGELAPS